MNRWGSCKDYAKPCPADSRHEGSGLRVQGLGFRVQGLGFRDYGLGFAA